ncbi:tetratricopeptide repeat-containing sensor histidine kinase [Limibacter armeniacum]|uniref:tetratricopeptide repeat-containing sensor histidine kinase n=1 Tax=Limibacter armeniacum TaxID=466084 RepID=UPI002FE5BF74
MYYAKKINNCILLLLALLLPALTLAQRNPAIDSLYLKLHYAEKDSNRVELLLQIAKSYGTSNPDSALHIADEALKESSRIGFQGGIARAYRTRGNCYFFKADYPEALQDYHESKHIFEQLNDTVGIAGSLQNIGKTHERQNDIPKAENAYRTALHLLDVSGNKYAKSFAFGNMANLCFFLQKYDSALYYHDKALALRKQLKAKNLIGYSYNDIAIVYSAKGDIEKGLEYYRKAHNLMVKANEKWGLASVKESIAETLYRLNNPDSALYYSQEAYKIANTIGAKDILMRTSGLLSFLYEENKDYKKALMFSQIYQEQKDSIFNRERVRQVAEITSKLAVEKRDAENQLLKEQQLHQKAKLARQHTMIVSVACCLLLTIVFMFYFYKQRNTQKQVNKLLLETNEEISTQNHILEQQSLTIQQKNSQLSKLNEDKNHLIGIVAHDLRNPLTSALSLSELLKDEDQALNEEQQICINSISHSLKRMDFMIRRILDIKAIDSGHLNIKMQKCEIDLLLEEIVAGMEVRATNKASILQLSLKPVEVEIDKNYFRQVMENLISNAIKFSPKNSTITIGIELNMEKAQVYVQDQGPGLSEADQQKLFGQYQKLSARPTGGEDSTGLGLSIAKKFTEAMNGSIWCESTPNNGAKFVVAFDVL